MKNFLVPVLMCGLLLAGCETKPPSDISSNYGQISGLRTDLLSENELKTAEKANEVVWLNAARVFMQDGSVRFYLELDYAATLDRGYLAIPPGESLILTVDGAVNKFAGLGSADLRQAQGTTVSERAMYEVTYSLLRDLARAKSVRVQVIGDHGSVDRNFAPENFNRFERFIKSFGKKQG
jgi:hypothetical protein